MKGILSTYVCPACGRSKREQANKFIVCRGGGRNDHKHTVKMQEQIKGIIQK